MTQWVRSRGVRGGELTPSVRDGSHRLYLSPLNNPWLEHIFLRKTNQNAGFWPKLKKIRGCYFSDPRSGREPLFPHPVSSQPLYSDPQYFRRYHAVGDSEEVGVGTWSWTVFVRCVGWLPAVGDTDAIGSSQSRDPLPGHCLVRHVPEQRRTNVNIIGWELHRRHMYVIIRLFTCCSIDSTCRSLL